jgi:N-acetylmuramoyl-L-alanine amidase
VAQQAGYSMPVSDDVLLAAVRLRYRPTASGQLVPEDFMPLQSTALWT